MSNLGVAFAKVFPSLHPLDFLFGLVLAGVMRLVLYIKSKNKKKFRQGEEYGSAVWGTEKDIEPYMDLSKDQISQWVIDKSSSALKEVTYPADATERENAEAEAVYNADSETDIDGDTADS